MRPAKRPTIRAMGLAAERISKLPKPVSAPFQSLNLDNPVERFSTLCQLDEWANVLGRVLDPPAEAELAKLRPIVATIEDPPSPPSTRPTSGPLADELDKLDQLLAELGPTSDNDGGPRMHNPAFLEQFGRETLRYSCSWVALDDRPGAAESQALHRWYKDPANLDALADRLGYTTAPRPHA